MLFSATFPKEVEDLARQTLKDPKRVAVGISRPAHTVAHALYPVSQAGKTPMLFALLKQINGSVLVFTRTKHRAQKVARQLEKDGYSVTALHGNRSQGQRQSALKGFRDGRFQVMVATDIAARGIDVENISHVINYDMPDTTDAYIHRIGRTGRAERTGDAFTLVTPEDGSALRALERVMGKPIERRTLEGFDYGAAVPKISTEPKFVYRSPGGKRNRGFPKGGGASARRGDAYAKRLASYR
jgi:ATP-dependent RNA helicase RhlE